MSLPGRELWEATESADANRQVRAFGPKLATIRAERVNRREMTETQLKAFGKALTNRQAELNNASASRGALAVQASADELDRIQEAGIRDWAMGDLERQCNQSLELESACRRIAAGTFGICVNCEGAISLKRLSALPWASCCIYCQKLADRQNETSASAEASNVMAA